MAQTVVPSHRLGLVISSSKGDVFIHTAIGGNGLKVRGPWWIDSSGAAVLSGGLGTLDVRIIMSANCLVVFIDLVVNQPFPVATMEILFSHKFLRCDLGILPQK
jgi:hypothetical protein